MEASAQPITNCFKYYLLIEKITVHLIKQQSNEQQTNQLMKME